MSTTGRIVGGAVVAVGLLVAMAAFALVGWLGLRAEWLADGGGAPRAGVTE